MKPSGWVRRFSRHFIAQPLKSIGITQRPVLIVRLAIGVLAALALASGPVYFFVAAGLWLVGIVLERTAAGFEPITPPEHVQINRHALISESVSNALAFVGLGIGMRASEYGDKALLMGLLAALGVALLPWLVRRLERIDGKRSAEFDGVAGLDADDVLFLVPVALWAGMQDALLLVSAVFAPTFVAAIYVTHYRKFSTE
ncbi:MAG: hypothetical protein AB8G17_11470 [Gammaproteobacteria bacterium]